MDQPEVVKKLSIMVWLLAANMIAVVVLGAGLVFGLLPKIERAVQSVERVESRFGNFADKVQPVVTAGAGKAIETIKKVDSDKLSETATEKTDQVIEAAAERAKRLFNRDKEPETVEAE
ncbi:6TM ABC transporter family protein [Aeoliella mucimassa]|uniref:Uncharacterized protein n=1 Tax=Aeoliella mucimassa TaxID=2527972 RepID=A0A518AUY8_9BACT|nr:hypothetical protein [Aeoliella mucimassa]QDU58522.1 hypothetical protein Pan181_47600 [Aeoliella mucimassa]